VSEPLPGDIRLMTLTANALFVVAGVLALGGALGWIARQPAFALAGIRVDGELTHIQPALLRDQVLPRLAGNFFTVDLGRVREAFESVPWVRQAVVRRQFPNRLRVTLEEHRPVARWGEEGDATLVNSFGEVFEAGPSDIDFERLPRLAGPQGQAPELLRALGLWAPALAPLGLSIDVLELSGRGGWRMELDNGAPVEVGRGSADELLPRLQRFARTLTQVSARYSRRADALEAADLRHADGYAIRLRGVTTLPAPAAAAAVRPTPRTNPR